MKILAITPEFKEEELFLTKTEEFLKQGISMLQYRDKNRNRAEKKSTAVKLKQLCEDYGTPLIINDDISLARELCLGVHLGQEDGSISEARILLGDAIIGATAHTLQEALRAEEEGADYLGCGALYPTKTKADTSPLSLEDLKEIVKRVSIPVYAIGGIRPKHVAEILETKASGIALSSSLYHHDDYHLYKPYRQGIPTVLSIAGSDCSGGAGIQADLKTFMSLGCYGMRAITALTAQNTQAVEAIHCPPASFLRSQLESIFSDIPPKAIKIGMLGSQEIIETLEEILDQYEPHWVVIDPVMVSTSGSLLLEEDAIRALHRLLFKAKLITPNIHEAEVLTSMSIRSHQDMEEAARLLIRRGIKAVLIKGGHLAQGADDLYMDDKGLRWYRAPRMLNPNTHGTGCTLSSAIAGFLALGETLEDAINLAKDYITTLLESSFDLGKGSGPLNHSAYRRTHESY